MCMSLKTFLHAAGAMFSLAALLHLGRLVFGWDLQLDGTLIPTWVSAVVGLVGAYLAWTTLKLKK
jgi:hypothetical protein